MTYLLLFLILTLTACTLVYVDVSSDEEGRTVIEADGIQVHVDNSEGGETLSEAINERDRE